MVRDDVEDIYPLSPTQEGMLFHTLYDPERGIYVEQIDLRLRGELNLAAFRKAWEIVVERHPVLRALVIWKRKGSPLVVVRREVALPFREEDWRDLPGERREERLRAFIREDLRAGIDFSKAPLMRLAVVRTAAQSYCFVWTYHHLLLDGWSTALVLREVSACYEELCRGQEPTLGPAVPYRSYVTWLRHRDASTDEAFWRRYLGGFTAATPLGVDRKAGSDPGRELYGEQCLHLSAEMTAALGSTNRQHRSTLNTLFRGMWALLLSRYGGEREVLFGTTVAGRPADLPGVETIVGLFINTLPVRVRVVPGESLLEWLRQLQAQQSAAQPYESTSLVRIREWSEVPADEALFESLLVIENHPTPRRLGARDQALEVTDFHYHSNTNYPLTLLVVPGEQLAMRVFSNRDRFEPVVIARLLSHLRNLVSGFLADPHRTVRSLSVLAAAERHQCLSEWNATLEAAGHRAGEVFTDPFRRQVARSPQAVAVVCRDQALTYQELDRRSERLARRLVEHGVGPEEVVALLAERGIAFLSAVLAIFKAGGAYLPLDPHHPARRHRQVLERSAVSLVLVQEELAGVLAEAAAEGPGAAPAVLLLGPHRAAAETPEPRPRNAAANLAYVIYTSGSTGVPKGAMVEQRGMVNHLFAKVRDLDLGPADRVAQTASQCFDISVWQLLAPLLVGARVVIYGDEVAHDPPRLLAAARRDRMSMLEVVPSVMEMLLPHGDGGVPPLPDLRWLIPTGEALPPRLCRRWQRAYPRIPLLNAYGPTECSDDVSHHRIRSAVAAAVTSIPIGRPVLNLRLHVLAPDLQPLPIGVTGELYVAGEGVGRGYLHDPGRTAEVFIPDPFAVGRLYRTGDFARFLPDGVVEFGGRIDFQVKIRGHRIELGEIEANLARHPAIEQAIVVVRETGSGGKRLIAFLVGEPQRPPGSGELRRWLAASLPDAMIPSAFVMLERLPLTPNGKVDRAALEQHEELGELAPETWVAPRTPLEEVVAAIWSEILEVERVGAHDHFSQLGGHSLLATQVISRIRESLQVELPIRTLFESPTVAAMAEAIEEKRRRAEGTSAPPLVATVREDPPPLSFAQQRLWVIDQLEPGSAAYNVPSAMRLSGELDAEALQRSLNEVVRRHEALRTTFASRNGQPFMVIASGLAVELPVIDLCRPPAGTAEREVRRLAMEELSKPFDLTRGPLLRALLLRRASEDWVLLLTLHHIISDEWSMGILIQELTTLYQAFRSGRRALLPELPIQYADFALWQQRWLQGQVLEAQLDHWRRHLAGMAPLDLPTDHPRPAERSYRGAMCPLVLPAPLTEALHRLGREEEATLFMIVLAAFTTLLSRYSGQDDVAVGTLIANRNRAAVEHLIGFFANTLVLRVDLAGNPTFRQLLRRVREIVFEAWSHQDLPFERLVKELQPERDLGFNPLFQVMFAVDNAPFSPPDLPQLTVSTLELDAPFTHFDLSFHLSESDGEVHGKMFYSTDLFEPTTIERMLDHFKILLRGVTAAPDGTLSELSLSGENELLRLRAAATAVPAARKLSAQMRTRLRKAIRTSKEHV